MRDALRHPHVERQSIEAEGKWTRCDVGVAIDRVRHRTIDDFGQRCAARVVDIHHGGRIRRKQLEQPALGSEVRLHVLVKIEMIARQVRVDPGSKADSIDPVHGEGV